MANPNDLDRTSTSYQILSFLQYLQLDDEEVKSEIENFYKMQMIEYSTRLQNEIDIAPSDESIEFYKETIKEIEDVTSVKSS